MISTTAATRSHITPVRPRTPPPDDQIDETPVDVAPGVPAPPVPQVDGKAVQDLLVQMVQINGKTYHERAVADFITQKMTAMGYPIREDDAAKKIGGNCGNLIAGIAGTIPDAPRLVFLCHMDTVALAQNVKPVVEDGVLMSGNDTALGADDRAGDSEILEALRTLKEKNLPHPPMQIIFTVAEEAGLVGSQALDAKDVHGDLGFEVDFNHPNEVLWGDESFVGGTDDSPHPRNGREQFLENFTGQAIQDLGLKPMQGDDGMGSSDSATLRTRFNIPAIVIGAGEQSQHGRQEHIHLAEVPQAEQLILTLIAKANQYKMDDGHIVLRSTTQAAA